MAHDDEDEPTGAPGAPPSANRSPYYRLPSPEDDDGDDGEAPRPYVPPALPYGAPPPARRPDAAPPRHQPYAQPPPTPAPWPHQPGAAAPLPEVPPVAYQPYAQPPPGSLPPLPPPVYGSAPSPSAPPGSQLPPPHPGPPHQDAAPQPVAPGGGGPGRSNAWWRRWWAISLFTVIGIVVLLGVIGAIAGDPDDSGAPVATTRRSRPPTTEAAAAPTASAGPVDTGGKGVGVVDGSGVAVGGVGAVLVVEDGARARVLSVTPAAEPLDDFSAPEPGSSLTRLDVELCAGTERLSVNPFSWSATLDDGTTVQPMFTGRELQTLGLAPGACTRGLLDLTVADGRSVSTVVLGDDLLRDAARWDVAAPAVAQIDGPLTAAAPIEPAPLGQPVIGPDGATIVLRGVEPEAAPVDDFLGPDEGHTLTRLDVELCAGSAPLPANPFYWYGRQDDGVTVGASFLSQGLALDDLAAGVCAQGTVDLEVALGTRIVEVIWVDQILDEGGRWAVA